MILSWLMMTIKATKKLCNLIFDVLVICFVITHEIHHLQHDADAIV